MSSQPLVLRWKRQTARIAAGTWALVYSFAVTVWCPIAARPLPQFPPRGGPYSAPQALRRWIRGRRAALVRERADERASALAVAIVRMNRSRRPGTPRDMRYCTQSARPTQTGSEVPREWWPVAGVQRVHS